MALNWINVEDFSFDHMLMLERFQIRLLCDAHQADVARGQLGIALRHNPHVAWYLAQRCPERAAWLNAVAAAAPEADAANARRCETAVMSRIEDFIIYTQPELMDSHCNFIYGWDKSRLYELIDLTDMVVLDVGSGSGRLAFAAAERAREVYASEPVDRLREYLRDKIEREHIRNVRVVDGMADRLPYPDDTFDIVMSGHVVGDDLDRELAEFERVVKSGGWILDCPGDEQYKSDPNAELIRRGYEMFHYISKFGGDVYRYRKQIFK